MHENVLQFNLETWQTVMFSLWGAIYAEYIVHIFSKYDKNKPVILLKNAHYNYLSVVGSVLN